MTLRTLLPWGKFSRIAWAVMVVAGLALSASIPAAETLPPDGRTGNFSLPWAREPAGGSTPSEEEPAPADKPARAPTRAAAQGALFHYVDQPYVPSTDVTMDTPWGQLPFSRRVAFQHSTEEGPGFKVSVPVRWQRAVQKHPGLGGMQYRFVAPNELTRVVVVVFPMEEQVDLVDFLESKQTELLSSFKNVMARDMLLRGRKGLGAYYQGILLCRDAACHVFLGRHQSKGYLVYGLYFDREGGLDVAKILSTVRIF